MLDLWEVVVLWESGELAAFAETWVCVEAASSPMRLSVLCVAEI